MCSELGGLTSSFRMLSGDRLARSHASRELLDSEHHTSGGIQYKLRVSSGSVLPTDGARMENSQVGSDPRTKYPGSLTRIYACDPYANGCAQSLYGIYRVDLGYGALRGSQGEMTAGVLTLASMRVSL